jgi:hypothetical protein
MRKHIVTFIILLMIALPVWSASMVCYHLQMPPTSMNAQDSDHHCCPEKQKQHQEQAAADTCYCDQLQSAQFILSLPDIGFVAPSNTSSHYGTAPHAFPERTDLLYRPPIA